jgi:TRAP-type C4-dicarboxylate transport system substrate-binding protein
MFRKLIGVESRRRFATALAVSLIGSVMLVVPGGSHVATAAETQYIRIATLAPRDSDLAKGFIKLDKGLRAATSNGWGVRLYPSGVAGDETDVIRKMKVGQMDASIITSIGLSAVVREVDVLNAPGLINNYKQLEAIQTALTPEWETAFDKAGFRLLAWGETGQYRWFAKNAINKPSDIKTMRPWVWPASSTQKEIYRLLGANGVPLAVPEVYGALQTGMVDMVISTSAAMVALQWHANLKHVTERTSGVLIGAMLMNSAKWKSMPADAQKHVQNEINKNTSSDKADVRQADDRSYQSLIKRGYVADKWNAEAEKEYAAMGDAVRKHLVGRLYSAELLDRAMKIAASAK